MRLARQGGILLHPTSLPGRFGIGDLGDEARRFIDFLAAARLGLWQVLPLGPTGYDDSPYASPSAFAGNPLLISPEGLLADGLLTPADLRDVPPLPADRVDYGSVIAVKRTLLGRAAERFRADGSPLAAAFERFVAAHGTWLDDYALFMALKDAHAGVAWTGWAPEIARRVPEAVARWHVRLADAVTSHKLWQFLFFRQWTALRGYAAERGVHVVGDMPIFVAHDSADVWARRELFFLDAAGHPTVVAGVPPDYFSATGQLWGNPLYRWDEMARQGFAWWIDRLRVALTMVDFVRLDHFIGLSRYWEIPAGATTAVNGRWLPGPGAALALALREAIGALPIIAEDLGDTTPEVDALRDRFELPGMKVLQFAFGADASNRFLPHHYPPNCVVYTGTHDNDTTTGWFTSAPATERAFVERYLGHAGDDIAWDMIRLAMSSVADTVIVPLQDVLAIGSEGRMNRPGRAGGNWAWRVPEGAIGEAHVARLRDLVEVYGREASRPLTQPSA